MRNLYIILLIFLLLKLHAQELDKLPLSLTLMNIDPPVADTLKGERAEIELGPTLTIHRYLGYATFVSAMTNGILGLINWSKYTSGETPSNALRYSHRALGYTTAGLAVITSTFGAINFWKLRDREVGRTKRTIHMALSTLATAGFITAAVLAYNSRRELERGTDKTFTQLYNRHRIIALTGFVSTLLTINWIIW